MHLESDLCIADSTEQTLYWVMENMACTLSYKQHYILLRVGLLELVWLFDR